MALSVAEGSNHLRPGDRSPLEALYFQRLELQFSSNRPSRCFYQPSQLQASPFSFASFWGRTSTDDHREAGGRAWRLRQLHRLATCPSLLQGGWRIRSDGFCRDVCGPQFGRSSQYPVHSHKRSVVPKIESPRRGQSAAFPHRRPRFEASERDCSVR
jgi:hypothetical protein